LRKFTKKNKYSNKKTEADGIKFDSKAEALFYRELLFRKKIGEIKTLELQPKIYLSKAKILYKPDFFVIQSSGKEYFVDVKGFKTPVFNIKARLWQSYMDRPLIIIKNGTEAKTIEGSMSAVKVKLTVDQKGVTADFEGAEAPRKIHFNGELSSDIEGLKAVIAFVSMYCARRRFTYELVDHTEKLDAESDQSLPPVIEETTPQGEDNINAEQKGNHESNSEKSNGKKSGKKANKKSN
jgi:hypothetical protein